MPSPIAHTAVGYLIYKLFRSRLPQQSSVKIGPVPVLLLATVGLSMLPDLDSVAGILMGDMGNFHNNGTHSLLLGLAVAFLAGGIACFKRRSAFSLWFMITLLCYELHVVLDFLTVGRGVMAIWPFSSLRYQSNVKLFYGLHWSQGWLSIQHIWTAMTESGFVAIIGFIMHLLRKRSLPRFPTPRRQQTHKEWI